MTLVKINKTVEQKKAILKPKPTTRKGWEKSFKKMNGRGEDKLLMRDIFDDESFDKQ
jgi:antitoxin MazE